MALPEISQRQEAPSRASNGPLIGGLLVVVAFVSVFLLLMNSTGYDTWGALPVGLILFVVSLPIFARQAARERDKRLFWFLTFALLLKLLGAIPRHFVAFGGLYAGADARDFLQWGAKLAPLFRSGNFHSGLPTLTSTNFIRFFTGIVYAVIGPTGLG